MTVVIKGRGSNSPSGDFCGSRDAVFYHAEVGSLPTTFSDGMREYGAYNSIQVNTVSPGEQVCFTSLQFHIPLAVTQKEFAC